MRRGTEWALGLGMLGMTLGGCGEEQNVQLDQVATPVEVSPTPTVEYLQVCKNGLKISKEVGCQFDGNYIYNSSSDDSAQIEVDILKPDGSYFSAEVPAYQSLRLWGDVAVSNEGKGILVVRISKD